MKKLVQTILATLAAGALAFGVASATSIPYYTAIQPSNIVSAFNDLIARINSSTGLVASLPGPIASLGQTAEQSFASTPLPPTTLTLPGQTLIIRCAGLTGSNGNTKTAHLYFGAFEYSTAAMSTSGESWELELTVQAATTTPNFVIYGRGTTNTTVVAPVATNDTELMSNSPVVKCTGTQGTASAADMTMENFVIFQEK